MRYKCNKEIRSLLSYYLIFQVLSKIYPLFKFEGVSRVWYQSFFSDCLWCYLFSSSLTILNLNMFPCVSLLFRQHFLTKQFFLPYNLYIALQHFSRTYFTEHNVLREKPWTKYTERENRRIPTLQQRDRERNSSNVRLCKSKAFSIKAGTSNHFLLVSVGATF